MKLQAQAKTSEYKGTADIRDNILKELEFALKPAKRSRA